MKKDRKTTLLTSLLFLLVGIILFANPGGVVKFITYIFGGIFLFMGIVYFIQYYKAPDKNVAYGELYSGIVSAVIGIIVMFCAGAIELAIRLITGAWILYRALMNLRYALALKELKDDNWIGNMVASFLLLVAGLYIILRSNLVLSSIGLVLIIYAGIELLELLYEVFPKKKKDIVIK